MTIDKMIQHLNNMTIDGDLYESLVAALRAAQQMRTQILKAGMIGREKAALTWDATTKGDEG